MNPDWISEEMQFTLSLFVCGISAGMLHTNLEYLAHCNILVHYSLVVSVVIYQEAEGDAQYIVSLYPNRCIKELAVFWHVLKYFSTKMLQKI